MGEREEGGEENTPVSKKHKKKVSFSFGEGEGEVGVTPPSTKKQNKKVKKEREQQQQEEEEGLGAVETPVKKEPEEMEVWSNDIATMMLELEVIPWFSTVVEYCCIVSDCTERLLGTLNLLPVCLQ